MADPKRQVTISDSKPPPFVIKTVEMHTGGEPVRIITNGYPKIEGKTILEKRAYVRDHLDVFRKRLLWEPRGHYDMYGALLVEPDDKTADIGVLFMHNKGYGTMCGHACIRLGRYVVDKGIVAATSPRTEVVIQCPTGPVKMWVDCEDGKSGRVRFHSVPAFVFALDQEVDVPNYGRVKVDIASGGAFYAFLPDSSLGLDLRTAPIEAVRSAAIAVTEAVKKAVPLRHPEHPEMAYLDGTIITDGRDEYDQTPTLQTSVFGGFFVDRSPCGSGTTARVAILTVVLRCAFDQLAEEDDVIWDGPDFKVISYGSKVLRVYNRHHIMGDAARGEFNLEIRQAQLEDDGKYSCYTDPKAAASALLTVVVPMPTPPTITGGELMVTAGEQLSLTCRASGGHPAARLTWLNGTRSLRSESQTTENLPSQRSGCHPNHGLFLGPTAPSSKVSN
uniref:trans-L-3-hydroxyproline dehydratase n=1 Tax=Branchiostoma floridae TaxID=7739 RepID=C3ZUH3_BRAFL|eukprot:XP_002587801.1 hypothetical protein BRAFLDRAFT_92246 [Branchiostoma floridae]